MLQVLHNQPSQAVPLPTGIRGIIYDVDNCIAPLSNDDITCAWDILFAEKFGLTLEEATRQRKHHYIHDGCSARGFYKQYGEAFSLPPDFADLVYSESGAASAARFIARHPVNPRHAELYALLHQKGLKQIVITQGHPLHYGPILDHLGATPYISHYIDRTSHPHEKLEAAVWHRALNLLGLLPHEVIVLEDTPRNLIWPGANGINTALIGGRDPGEAAPSIHYYYDTAHEVQEHLLLT